MKKLIMVAGVVAAAILISKSAKAETSYPLIQTTPGKIIPIDTKVFGECLLDKCAINKEITIYSSFINVGDFAKTDKIGIMINNEIVKEENVTLHSYQEYTLFHNIELRETKIYEICGVIL